MRGKTSSYYSKLFRKLSEINTNHNKSCEISKVQETIWRVQGTVGRVQQPVFDLKCMKITCKPASEQNARACQLHCSESFENAARGQISRNLDEQCSSAQSTCFKQAKHAAVIVARSIDQRDLLVLGRSA
uniref:Uncharacterized protein n=1 Tax=Setaria digitata TaxID=48799 RepID=A0A915PVJ9_9BILA